MDFIFSLLFYMFTTKLTKKSCAKPRQDNIDFLVMNDVLYEDDNGNLVKPSSHDPYINGASEDGPEW